MHHSCLQGHLQFFMKEHDEALKTYEQGLTYDKDNQELKDGLFRCQQAINKVSHGRERRNACWLQSDGLPVNLSLCVY